MDGAPSGPRGLVCGRVRDKRGEPSETETHFRALGYWWVECAFSLDVAVLPGVGEL